jgi:uncharacterized protein YjiK
MERMSRYRFRTVLAAITVGCLATAACNHQNAPQGSAEIHVLALSSADVTTVQLTVSGVALAHPRVFSLFKQGSQWGGTVGGLPVATGYTFTASASGAGNTELYHGQTSGVSVTADQVATVVITAQQVNPPPPYANAVPVIDSLVISSTNLAPGDVATVKAVAHDPNPGDSLTIAWTSTGGAFANPAAAHTTFSAPPAAGSYTLTLTASDDHGASASATVTVYVSLTNARGNAGVNVSLNTSPSVMGFSAVPSRVRAGEVTTLAVAAADPDGDPLTYAWTSTCAGSFSGSGASVGYQPAGTPSATTCDMVAVISDGRGGSNVATLTLPVGAPAFIEAPAVVGTVQSASLVEPNARATLMIQAADANGLALTFSWAATAGTRAPSTDTSDSSTVVWTAPTAALGAWDVTVTVTNAMNVSTTYTFSMKPKLASIDLSRYTRIGRYNLPEPTRTTPPDGTSLLAQEASSVTYDWDTDTLFVVGDGGTSVVQISKTGVLINAMTLAPGASPQGTEFYDTEGVAYVGGGKFVLVEERYRQVNLFAYVAGATLHRADVQTVKLGTTIGNIGLEGVTFDPATGHYIFVKEKEPRSIFETGIDFAAGTATNGSATTDESIDLFSPSLVRTLDFSDVFALSNLPSLSGDPTFNQLLIISQESGQIVQVDRSGSVKHTLSIVADPADVISVPDMTMEGVTMDRNGILYVVNENGGGDAHHPQLWVYAPSSAANLAPTAVSLAGTATSLPEITNTAAAVKLADLRVTDDGLGDNNLSVSGPDAASFEIVGTALFLRAGTALNATTKPSLSVVVNVDDTTVGGTPDASTSYTLAVTGGSSGVINLAVTEAAPWSSGNSPLAADWFEVTNLGTSSVSLLGWTMDDNSNAFAVSVPLSGVASISPGESVIFIETASAAELAAKKQAFINLWFGGAAPAGLQIGSYSGSGVGLSTGGDAINLFDNGGTVRAAVSFGASPSGSSLPTYDNAAGLNNVTISTLSVVGQSGAFVAAQDANEIGSPGTIGAGATPIVGITATDNLASEAAGDPGVFHFTRTGSTTSPMTIIYTIATGPGQATSADYTPALGGSVVIPAGATSVDVTIIPVDDALVEGAETVTLVLTDTGNYDVGADASATVTVQDNDTANLAPTAAALLNTVPTLSEATDVSSRVRVADISVTDDGRGTNNLSVTGTDAASFEVVGASLYLKAGTVLSHASKPTLAITVTVDDPTVGGTPDATTSLTLTVTQAAPSVVISEVAPWSSGNSPLGADWFEVTNTGNTTVDLTGWKMDDNSHSIANAVALAGVTSIAPGEAVIFIETSNLATAAATFRSLWFGANPQRAPQIGSYSGSGVGLSSSADEVVLFDGAGTMVTGVGFGASPAAAPFATFDNHAGIGGKSLPLPVLSTLSTVGTNGGFLASDGIETGSPGVAR